jgi:hypothetical protein
MSAAPVAGVLFQGKFLVALKSQAASGAFDHLGVRLLDDQNVIVIRDCSANCGVLRFWRGASTVVRVVDVCLPDTRGLASVAAFGPAYGSESRAGFLRGARFEFWILMAKLVRAHGGCLGVRRR